MKPRIASGSGRSKKRRIATTAEAETQIKNSMARASQSPSRKEEPRIPLGAYASSTSTCMITGATAATFTFRSKRITRTP